MTYVDDLHPTIPSRRWPYSEACHLTADSHEELEAMARRLRLRPEWIQHAGRPTEHYDLTPAKRAQAVRYGAREETRRDAARRTRVA